MKFDTDRFAKLAGIRSVAEPTPASAPAAPAAVLKESTNRLEESADVKRLRQIIRSETRAILETSKASKKNSVDSLVESAQRSKSLKDEGHELPYGYSEADDEADDEMQMYAGKAEADEDDEMGGPIKTAPYTGKAEADESGY